MVAAVSAVAVAMRLGNDGSDFLIRSTNAAPYCSRPALLGPGLR
jgi:hypothetical protein